MPLTFFSTTAWGGSQAASMTWTIEELEIPKGTISLQIWRFEPVFSSVLTFPLNWHLTPNHLYKNFCSTQNTRRKLRKSKYLLRCSCTAPGKAVHTQPFTPFTFWLLPCSHLRSINYQSTAFQPCPVTTVWCEASNPLLTTIDSNTIYTHIHRGRYTQIFTKHRLSNTLTLHTQKLKKCSATPGRAEKRILFLKDFSVAQKKTSISATGYSKWLLEWNTCLL